MVSSAVLSLADVTSETIAALWTKIYGNLRSDEVGRGMLVCKSFHELLPPLITSIDSEPPRTQESFERFAKTYRHLEDISFQQDYDDDVQPLDWSKVSFPNLTSLTLSCCPVKSFEFTKNNTPSLTHLSISNQGRDADAFKLDLPQLTHIDMEFCSVSLVITTVTMLAATFVLKHALLPCHKCAELCPLHHKRPRCCLAYLVHVMATGLSHEILN